MEVFAQKLAMDFIGNSKKFKSAHTALPKEHRDGVAYGAKQSSEITLGVFYSPILLISVGILPIAILFN